MASKLLLTAAIYICLGVPALSMMILPHPRKHGGGFGFPPGKLLLPGKHMKHPILLPGKHMKLPILRPMPFRPRPRPGFILKRFPPKPFPIMKKIRKIPFHAHMMHKMKKMKMSRMSFPRSLPMRLRPAPWGGSHRRQSIRPGGYSRGFVSNAQTRGRRGGYGKRQTGHKVKISQPFQQGGAISGVRGNGYSHRPAQDYGNRRSTHGQDFRPVNQDRNMFASQRTEQHFGGGFQGGRFRNDFRTLDDIDIFDRSFDDRFDRGFELDNINNNIRDTDDDFRDSLEVPDIFDDRSEQGHLAGGTTLQTPTRSTGYYNRRGWQRAGPGLVDHDEDDIGNFQAHTVANFGSAGAQGINPFNIQPGFLQGHTGVNAGGGIGILQNSGHFDDAFDDTDKRQPVSVNINFNAMDPFSGNGQVGASSQLQVAQLDDLVDDGKLDVELTGVPGHSQGGAHVFTEKGDADDTRIVTSGISGHGGHSDGQIDGVEMLGDSHPNMLANTGFWEHDRDSGVHGGGHPQSATHFPFNAHSDDSLQSKDSTLEHFSQESLELLGIDPRTLDDGMINDHFDMQSSVPTATSPPVHAQFPRHQPAPLPDGIFQGHQSAQLPDGTFQGHQSAQISDGIFQGHQSAQLPDGIFQGHQSAQLPGGMFSGDQTAPLPDGMFNSVDNQLPFQGSTFDQQPEIPSDISFISTINQNPQQQMFASEQFGHQTSQSGTVNTEFPDIPMNADIFQDFQAAPNGAQPTHTGFRQVPAHQFPGAGHGPVDDLSLLSQIPSVDNLAFGMDQFSGHGQ